MDGGSSCPICMAEYTLNGEHRAVSLKCGHLFGSECITKWMSTYKRNYCPTCLAPCRKSHIRPLFAVKIEATDVEKEKEMIDKYIKESKIRKELEIEIIKLKSQIEIMKTSSKQMQSTSKIKRSKIHMNFQKYCKIHFFPDNSIIGLDAINQAVLISCCKNGQFGLFKYSLYDFSIYSFIELGSPVKDFKISPFNDGLCLVAHGMSASLLNIYTENVVKSFNFEFSVSAIEFCILDRSIVFVADLAGWLYICNLETVAISKIKVCGENIHSIAMLDEMLYIATVFGVYLYKGKNFDKVSFEKININPSCICSSITSDGVYAFAVFRDTEYNVTGALLGEKFIVFKPEAKQFFRHNDKVLNDYLMLSDDNKNSIQVLDINTLQMVFSYTFKEPIVGFCGDLSILTVLTKRGIYIYNSAQSSTDICGIK
jgi:E3 ubiquitin-protein ligase RFWD3